MSENPMGSLNLSPKMPGGVPLARLGPGGVFTRDISESDVKPMVDSSSSVDLSVKEFETCVLAAGFKTSPSIARQDVRSRRIQVVILIALAFAAGACFGSMLT